MRLRLTILSWRLRYWLINKISRGEFSVIRRNPDGTVDDVVISCNMFRLEQMDDGFWWCAAVRGDKTAHFYLFTEDDTPILVNEYDDLGCYDDTKDKQRA